MNILIMLLLLAAAVAAFFTLAWLLEWEAVDGVRQRLWGEWSSKFQMGGIAALLPLLPIDPVTGLYLWNMMPREVRTLLPPQVLLPVALTLFVLSWLSKYYAQNKLRAKIEAKKK